MTTKQEIEQLMQVDGQVKGSVFQTDAKYIERLYGQEGAQKLEETLKNWGTPINYQAIKAMEWYPAGLRVVSLLAVKETFKMNDDDIFNMGLAGPKRSFLIKTLLKFFVSIEKIFQTAPMVWKRHWSIGELELIKIDEANKQVVIRLNGVKLHPIFCKYEEGFFSGILRFTKPNARAIETKCMFKNAPYHEYTFSWEKA